MYFILYISTEDKVYVLFIFYFRKTFAFYYIQMALANLQRQ